MGLTSPGKRASNRAVFSLSSTFRHTTRPRLRSRTRQTFDMLPWPMRPSRSKRLLMSIRGSLDLVFAENRPLKNPTAMIPMPESLFVLSVPGASAGRLNPRWRSGLVVHGMTKGLVFAIVNDPGHLGPQVLARYDAIDEPVREEKLARLKALGQFQADGVPDGAFTGEANEGAWLGEKEVALGSE